MRKIGILFTKIGINSNVSGAVAPSAPTADSTTVTADSTSYTADQTI